MRNVGKAKPFRTESSEAAKSSAPALHLRLTAHLQSLRTFYEPLTPPLRERAQARFVQQEQAKNAPLSWEAFAAAASFVGGILATLFGVLLTVITWILGVGLHPWLRWVSTALFVLTIPLLIFAGYCLDWMERKLTTHHKKNSRSRQQSD
jgi:hypothetical protein